MVNRRYDIFAIVFVGICIVAYTSIQPEFRLRPEMPKEFFDPSRAPANRRVAEEKIARAYWKCAVTQVQWKYGYAHRLPEQPPEDFSIATRELGGVADDSERRTQYWQKLRAIWSVSTIWQKRYAWNNDTLRNSLQSAGDWLRRFAQRILG